MIQQPHNTPIKTVAKLLSLFVFCLGLSATAYSETQNPVSYQNAVADIGLRWEPSAPSTALQYHSSKVAQPKSALVALGYAVLPGYIIPAAFGHAYAEAKTQAAVISSARLSGRLMWMYSFFDNFWVKDSGGEISGGAMTMFYAGLALDLGGYLYDIIHAPIEVANYNRRFFSDNKPTVSPFIDIKNGGPCCGLAFKF